VPVDGQKNEAPKRASTSQGGLRSATAVEGRGGSGFEVHGDGDLDLATDGGDGLNKVAELEDELVEVVDVLDVVGVGDEDLELEGAMNADGSWKGEGEGRKLRFELPINFGCEMGKPAMEPLLIRLRSL